MKTQRDTDIAVILQRYGGDWRVLAYVGPGRMGCWFSAEELHAGGSVEVRYLDEKRVIKEDAP